MSLLVHGLLVLGFCLLGAARHDAAAQDAPVSDRASPERAAPDGAGLSETVPDPAVAAAAPAAAAAAAPATKGSPTPPSSVSQAPPSSVSQAPPSSVRKALQLPLDPVAAKAYTVLDKHCARCHQAGKLRGMKPAAGFGNILRLDEIAQDAALVRRGVPDGSKLYSVMLKREMPFDVYQQFSGGAQPSAEDLQNVRDWIKELGERDEAASSKGSFVRSTAISATIKAGAKAPAAPQAKAPGRCDGAKFISNDMIGKSIATVLANVAKDVAADMRFIGLTHLHNACVSKREMKAYRQAVVKLLNSLSRAEAPVRLTTLDREKTIIKFKLSDLGWTAATWEMMLALYPYRAVPQTPEFEILAGVTGSALPLVRGDWLAYALSRPEFYARILRQPETLEELQDALGVAVQDNIDAFAAERAGLLKSRYAKRNRLVERHASDNGYYWTTYDFGKERKGNLASRPLGPYGKNAFQHQLNAVIYALPNGFNAYFLADAKGNSIAHAPLEILVDVAEGGRAIASGLSCSGCHARGPIDVSDAVGTKATINESFDVDMREAIGELYIAKPQMDQRLSEDRAAYARALVAAGLDPALTLDGSEIINALANRYARDADIHAVAAEYGLSPDAFVKALSAAAKANRSNSASEIFSFSRRLSQAIVPRVIVERLYTKVLSALGGYNILPPPDAGVAVEPLRDSAESDAETQPEAARPSAAKLGGRSFDLAIFSDKSRYRRGDSASIWVTTSRDCNLTVINVDRLGKGTAIFPNDFKQDNVLNAGDLLELPGEAAPYKFRMRDRGFETLIAICNTKVALADGIETDFEKQKFTNLGDYDKFLQNALKKELTGRGLAARVVKKRRRRSRRRRRNGRRYRRSRDAGAGVINVKPEIQARAAIRVEVR